jgi:hypothetical protein
VSQLHARAVQRLRKSLGGESTTAEAAAALRPAILAFQQTMRRMKMAKVDGQRGSGVVLPYKMPTRNVAKQRPAPTLERRVAAR